MKEITLLRRTFVKKLGVCEAKSTIPCDDDVAAHLVETKHAKYSTAKEAAIAKAEATAKSKIEA